jgi:hypothetical protein
MVDLFGHLSLSLQWINSGGDKIEPMYLPCVLIRRN